MARKGKDSPEGEGAAKPAKVKKRRWYHQVWEVFKDVRAQQPSILWIMLGVIVVGAGLGYLIAWLVVGTVAYAIFGTLTGLMFGVLGAMIILTRRAEKFAYERIEGRPGAVSAVLDTIKRGWNIEPEPVAFDARNQDLVFRAVGRPGVVLISEGPSHRVAKLLEGEKRKVQRVVPHVPVTFIEVGRGEGQVPLPQLVKVIRKQKKAVKAPIVPEISKRLRALQHMRGLPVPKGIDPNRARPDRKAAKGR